MADTITLIITSFREPKTIGRAIEAALEQTIRHPVTIVIAAPDTETLAVARTYARKFRNITVFKDPGKGKSFALNLLFKKVKSDIFFLTDGDVYLSKNALAELYDILKKDAFGAVTGRPVPVESKDTKYGYWAHFLFDAAHQLRKESFAHQSFIECSGYLFGFKRSLVSTIPLDVAEDTIIPYYVWQQGKRIGYAEKALVYVKNATTWKDWITQKVRTSKAHETLDKYVDTTQTKRVKSFSTESRGIGLALKYPRKIHEYIWTVELIFARLYMWIRVLYDTRYVKKTYSDGWERIESSK